MNTTPSYRFHGWILALGLLAGGCTDSESTPFETRSSRTGSGSSDGSGSSSSDGSGSGTGSSDTTGTEGDSGAEEFELEVLDSLILWLRADVGVSEGGGSVEGWDDQSGELNDAFPGGGEHRPQWVEGALNGLPVLRFESNDYLAFGEPLMLEDMTIFVVARSNHPGEDFHELLGPGSVNNQIRYESSTELLSVGTGNDLPVIVSEIGNNKVYHSLTIRFDGTTWEVYRDGLTASATEVEVSGAFELGRVGAWFGGQYGLVGDVAEVLVYETALGEAERELVEGYLRDKYALP